MKKHIYSDQNPLANNTSIVQGEKYRFTILTSKLIRAEYSENGVFEDRQTKVVLNRKFEPVNYTVIDKDDYLEIITDDVIVQYYKTRFSNSSLVFRLKGNYSSYKSTWYFGEEIDDLKGTAHTLDYADGPIPLERGLMSEKGFSVIDDSRTIILTDDGWYKKKENKSIDIYYFGYGRNYLECLYDYYQLTGFPPMLPKFTLGNWWSRYYKYSESSYMELIHRFEEEKIPFSVAVIDMDWHLVDIPEKYGSGWTGYTWNRDLFPKPERFIKWLKKHGLRVTLNVHPAEGVRPFEEQYIEMAKELNVDWEKEEYITFDVTNEDFLSAYFKYLHYPNEKIGVDFWWVDWQQGGGNRFEGIDPQWVLNHYHFHDANKKDRNITFSRYSGPGSHRYPVGFSGDTIISWESLEFQPYFTANASNIGYTWWSHDIGGHMRGYYCPELTLRWVQLGVFSPINRLHSSSSVFLGKEPWKLKEPFRSIVNNYLRLRHKLIPYLYTMNYQTHAYGKPLIMPLYYLNPENKEAYEYKSEFYFGSELLVMPMIKPVNEQTRKAVFNGWLPEGCWYDIFTGQRYNGGKRIKVHRGIDNTAVFAKEGAILPLAMNYLKESLVSWTDLIINIYSGAEGYFELIEDEIEGEVSKTDIYYKEFDKEIILKTNIKNLKNKETRNYRINIIGKSLEGVKVITDSASFPIGKEFIEQKNKTILDLKNIPLDETIKIQWENDEKTDILVNQLIIEYLLEAEISNDLKEVIYDIITSKTSVNQKLSNLWALDSENEIIEPIIEVLLG